MNDYDKMQFVKDTAKADRFFFHYLLGYMSNLHMDEMVECAKAYREDPGEHWVDTKNHRHATEATGEERANRRWHWSDLTK